MLPILVLIAPTAEAAAENLLISASGFLLLLLQLPAFAIALSRIIRGALRYPPLQPQQPQVTDLGQVSVVVPTLNEAERISPCLEGLSRQSYEVREVIVVDSYSEDGTPDQVKATAVRDPRFRLINDPPLPVDWVGRPWALHNGFLASSSKSEWILGIDADTQPQPGLVASLIHTAHAGGYDLITLSPRFILRYPGELLLQPALLMTLLYRFGAAGERGNRPERVMANGQCFFCRRSQLAAVGGYAPARRSFCDDVTLARYLAATGATVGFLDGANLLKVRMYEGAAETWREWGRSLDLKDAATPAQTWGDVGLLLAVQFCPLWVVLWLLPGVIAYSLTPVTSLLFGLNLGWLLIRCLLNGAILFSYDLSQAHHAWLFWLSPLTDPLAALRILLSALQTPKQWRGRSYR